jgi:hypothetical protein
VVNPTASTCAAGLICLLVGCSDQSPGRGFSDQKNLEKAVLDPGHPTAVRSIVFAPCQEDPPARLIDLLSSDRPEVRDEAMSRLKERGDQVRAELEKAARSVNLEVALRAGRLLASLKGRESLMKLEESISRAKTVRVTIRAEAHWSLAGGDLPWKSSGTLLLKGNKALYRYSGARFEDSGPFTDFFVSDGRVAAKFHESDRLGAPSRAIPDLGSRLASAFARFGESLYLERVWGTCLGAPDGSEFDPVKACPLSDVEEGDAGAGIKILTITFSGGDSTGPSETEACYQCMKVWYESATLKLLKRNFDLDILGSRGSITETYGEFVLNEDIPDEQFVVPDSR